MRPWGGSGGVDGHVDGSGGGGGGGGDSSNGDPLIR